MFDFSVLRFISSIFLIVVLVNCKSNHDNLDGSLILKYSELNIDHNDLVLSNYFFQSKIFGEDSLWSFDVRTNALGLFDLKKNSAIDGIKFDADGPNFLGNQVSDFIITKSSVIMLDLDFISLFDFNGRIKKRIELNEIPGYGTSFRLDKMVLINDAEVLISIAHLVGRLPGTPMPEETPLFLTLNIQTDAVKILPLSYPPQALLKDSSQGYWGITSPVTLLKDKSRIVYSFGFSSEIFEFDLLTQDVSVHQATTKLTSNEKPPLPSELYHNSRELAKFGLGGLNFKGVHYDAENERYFRLHSLVEFKNTGEAPERAAFITVLNSDFETIHEARLGDDLIPYSLLNNGDLIIKKLTETEGRYDLALVQVSQN